MYVTAISTILHTYLYKQAFEKNPQKKTDGTTPNSPVDGNPKNPLHMLLSQATTLSHPRMASHGLHCKVIKYDPTPAIFLPMVRKWGETMFLLCITESLSSLDGKQLHHTFPCTYHYDNYCPTTHSPTLHFIPSQPVPSHTEKVPLLKRGVDCGAGIGRVTIGLLSKVCEVVDVVEPIERFTDKTGARTRPRESNKGHHNQGQVYNIGLENWTPSDPQTLRSDMVSMVSRPLKRPTITSINEGKKSNEASGMDRDKGEYEHEYSRRGYL